MSERQLTQDYSRFLSWRDSTEAKKDFYAYCRAALEGNEYALIQVLDHARETGIRSA